MRNQRTTGWTDNGQLTGGVDEYLLLILRSPATSLGFTILGETCAYATVFNPTIKEVTFRLRGWCMLGVFFVANIHPSRT